MSACMALGLRDCTCRCMTDCTGARKQAQELGLGNKICRGMSKIWTFRPASTNSRPFEGPLMCLVNCCIRTSKAFLAYELHLFCIDTVPGSWRQLQPSSRDPSGNRQSLTHSLIALSGRCCPCWMQGCVPLCCCALHAATCSSRVKADRTVHATSPPTHNLLLLGPQG